MEAQIVFNAQLKRGSLELLILTLLEAEARHGYQIGKLIESHSRGKLQFALPSLYTTLLRLEERGWIKGRWVEKPGRRQRCFYRLTSQGRRQLASHRKDWQEYVRAVNRVMESAHA